MANHTTKNDKRKDLNSTQLKVYKVLEGMSKKFCEVFPTIATLARLTGKCETTVINAIRDLKRLNHINTYSRHLESGRQTSNGYIIVQPEQEKPKEEVAPLYKSFLKSSLKIKPFKKIEMNECAYDPDTPILEILEAKLKRLNHDGINIGKTYIPEIFPMLKRFFEKSLTPEIVSIACDLFLDEYCKANKYGGFRLFNPVGWFQHQFKRAVNMQKAKNFILQKKGI